MNRWSGSFRAIGVAWFLLCFPIGKISAQELAIHSVHVVDVLQGELLEDHTVLIEGDRIVAIDPVASTKIPPGTPIVDGRGKYLIPGLWDMHVHLDEPGIQALPVLVANGVTSVRDMGSPMSVIQDYRKTMASGEIVGPRIKAAGMMITNPQVWQLLMNQLPEDMAESEKRRRLRVETPEEMREAVRRGVRDGADFIKLHWNNTRETFLALADECRKQGFTFAGHDPMGDVKLRELIREGQRSIEHIDGTFAYQLGQMSREEREETIAEMKEHGFHFVPTITTFFGMEPISKITDADAKMKIALEDPRGAYVSERIEEFWRFFFTLYPQLPPLAMFNGQLTWLAKLHEKGVRMMPGTDLGVPLVYPGFSLHDELEYLVTKVKMTPHEALRSGTLYPAEFFGMEKELGTVETGKIADLVILGANPLEDIGNTRRIEGVVLGGAHLGPAALKALLAKAEVR